MEKGFEKLSILASALRRGHYYALKPQAKTRGGHLRVVSDVVTYGTEQETISLTQDDSMSLIFGGGGKEQE